MDHHIPASNAQAHIRACDLTGIVIVKVGDMLVAGRRRAIAISSISDKNKPILALDLAHQPQHIGIYMDTLAVADHFGVNFPVIVYRFVYANTTAFRILGQVAGGVGVVGAQPQAVRHQRFDLLGRSLRMAYCKQHSGVSLLGIDHKPLNVLPFRSQRPNLHHTGTGFDHRHIVLRIDGKPPGIMLPVRAELGIHVWAFHIDTGDVCTLRQLHGGFDLIDLIYQTNLVHAEVQRRQHGGRTPAQMMLAGFHRHIENPTRRAGMQMDIHKTRAYI